jgi:hypothetical protein
VEKRCIESVQLRRVAWRPWKEGRKNLDCKVEGRVLSLRLWVEDEYIEAVEWKTIILWWGCVVEDVLMLRVEQKY